jgi:hypothetical protein
MGEMIGEKVGVWLEADVGEDDLAAGEFLRIKVKIDITKPLMRGMMIQVGEGRSKWCPFGYEYLPEFCYNCGVIGHDDKCCPIPRRKGEERQFGSWLRAYIPKKQNSGERQRWNNGGGSGSGSRSYGFGERRGVVGSNSLSWRKDDSNRSGSADEMGKTTDKVEEVTSPLKKMMEQKADRNPDGRRKALDWATRVELQEQEQAQEEKEKQYLNESNAQSTTVCNEVVEGLKDGQAPQVPTVPGKQMVEALTRREEGELSAGEVNLRDFKGKKFKRRCRVKEGTDEGVGVKLGAKRDPDQIEMDESEGHMSKKGKIDELGSTPAEAGLSEQPCKSQ